MTPRTARRGDELTDRERQVLLGVARGLTNAEIARELFLTVDTIKTHLRITCIKLGARTRANAVHLAHLGGLLGAHRPRRHGDHAGFVQHVRRGEDPKGCALGCYAAELAYRAAHRAPVFLTNGAAR